MPNGIISMYVEEEVTNAVAGCEDGCECMACDSGPCFCFTGGSGGGGDE